MGGAPFASAEGRSGPSPWTRIVARRGGFTLLEVLVTLAILSTGIVLVLSAMSASTAALDEGRDVIRMQLFARELVDQARSGLSTPGAAMPQPSGQYRAPYEAYRWTLDTAAVSGGGGGSQALYRVSAVVSKDGSSHRCAVDTYVCGIGGAP